MSTIITTRSGATRSLPDHVGLSDVLGLDSEGRIVVVPEFAEDYAFGLTLCCDAYDKGVDEGAVCRACYGPEAGSYLFRAADGSFTGLDPVR